MMQNNRGLSPITYAAKRAGRRAYAMTKGRRDCYLRRRGIEALGLGDVKFIAAAGLWVGTDGIFLVIALVGVIRQRRLVWPDPAARIPFGPGLILATVAVFLGTVFPPAAWPGLL